MGNRDTILIREDIATLKADNRNQSKKINEMHKALMGNGQPGIVAEWNQWKGGVKFFGVIVGSFIGLLAVAVGALAYIK